METLKKLWNWWSSLSPSWIRAVVALLVVALAFLVSVSCGQTVKVTVRDTPSGVSISTSQNKADSSNTSIDINPTINLH